MEKEEEEEVMREVVEGEQKENVEDREGNRWKKGEQQKK
jgi:hypothetical protein